MVEPAAPTRPLVLVTGASAGLGAAFARAYAARGFDLALTARRAERLEALAAELSAAHAIQAFAIPADLAGFEAHLPILQAIADAGGASTCWSTTPASAFPSFAGAPWARQRDFLMTLVVNACGLAHAVIPPMLARGGGSIVNVASLAGFSPGVAGNSLYPGAKGLMIKFSQALDAEYRARGLKVTAICPGFTKTEFADAAGIQSLMDAAPAPSGRPRNRWWRPPSAAISAGGWWWCLAGTTSWRRR